MMEFPAKWRLRLSERDVIAVRPGLQPRHANFRALCPPAKSASHAFYDGELVGDLSQFSFGGLYREEAIHD
jgi:hypothetical protein